MNNRPVPAFAEITAMRIAHAKAGTVRKKKAVLRARVTPHRKANLKVWRGPSEEE